MTSQQVVAAVDDAVAAVNREDPRLDLTLAHERATAHRLAVHMEEFFVGWNVDCEYDRDGQTRKALEGIKSCDDQRKTDLIMPDIIVHHRREEGRKHNLIVIELKKNAAEDPCDTEKLMRFTDPSRHYKYQFGLYLNIDNGRFTQTWYVDGKRAALDTVLNWQG